MSSFLGNDRLVYVLPLTLYALNNVVLSPSIPLKIISGFNSTKDFVVTFKNAQLKLVSFVASIKAKSQSLASNELHVRNNDPELSIVS